MAARKVQIEIDEDLVRRARERVAGDESDSDAVARALTVYFGLVALDQANALGTLSAEEADQVAVDEVRAHRASRGRAA